jgi:hypothetical protein
MQDIRMRYSPLWAGLICTVLYLFFPTNNSTSDAYGYAMGAEIGPHHLLFDLLTQWLRTTWHLTPLQVLAGMKGINAIAGGIAIVCAGNILKKMEVPFVFWNSMLCGVSFGMMRFATENEAYILPLAFALAATYSYVQYLIQDKGIHIISTWICIAVAILFHQSYIFWALGIFISMVLQKKHLSRLFIPVIAAIGVILFYTFFALKQQQQLAHWVVQDAQEGLVDLSPGIENFKFTAMNLVRSFIQIHGNIPILLHGSFYLWILAAISVVFLIISVGILVTKTKLINHSNNKHFLHLFIWIFLLHLGFAWFSVGNAEFMVMLPTILVFIVAIFFSVKRMALVFLTLGMALWNLSASIIPLSKKDLNYRSTEVQKVHGLGDAIFISHHRVELENYIAVHESSGTIKNASFPLLLKSPADAENEDDLSQFIALQQLAGKRIYTDCIHYPEIQNRKNMLGGNKNDAFFQQYTTTVVDSFPILAGWVYISRLEGKKNP